MVSKLMENQKCPGEGRITTEIFKTAGSDKNYLISASRNIGYLNTGKEKRQSYSLKKVTKLILITIDQ